MKSLARILFGIVLAAGLSAVFARFQFDGCDEHLNKPFETFELSECRDTDECLIDKGREVTVASWSFYAPAASTTARLSILIGSSTDDGKRSSISELELDQPDLCQLKDFWPGLSAKPTANANHYQCHIEPAKLIQLAKDQKFYVAKLLPSGFVNVTIQLRGDTDMLACALFRATLQ